MSRPEIDEVFIARTGFINAEMYVDRPDLEEDLIDSIKGSMHTMLFGESGNGKSWLYKHVLAVNNIPFVVANCGNASRLGSLTAEIHKACMPTDHLSKTSVEDTKEVGIKAIGEAKLSNKNKYDLLKDEPLLQAFKELAKKSRKSVIVIENLEAIRGNQNLVDELSNIILLLDDDRYAEFGVKFLIVGTPNGVLEFFEHSKNLSSVSNRVEEITKVSGMTAAQVAKLIKQGFAKLKIGIQPLDIEYVNNYVMHKTLGIAQRVVELCNCIAKQVKNDNWVFSRDHLGDASEKWLKKGLRASYVVIDARLNSIETIVGRRNQVIYAIGKINKSQFNSSDIETCIRSEFPSTIPETNMGIGSILTELCEAGNPILKRAEKASIYTVLDPVHIMAIRLILVKDKTSGKVVKRTFKTN